MLEVKLMLITEFDQELYEKTILKEGIEIGIEQGMETGMKKGVSRLRQLYMLLSHENKTDDMERIMWDEDFCNKSLQKYNL